MKEKDVDKNSNIGTNNSLNMVGGILVPGTAYDNNNDNSSDHSHNSSSDESVNMVLAISSSTVDRNKEDTVDAVYRWDNESDRSIIHSFVNKTTNTNTTISNSRMDTINSQQLQFVLPLDSDGILVPGTAYDNDKDKNN